MGLAKPAWPVLQRGHPLTNGLVGGWPFYEGSGSTLHDLSGNGINGGIVGGPPWIGSPLGSALSLNGSTQYVDLGTSINPVAVTYCAWIIPTALSNAYSAVIDRHATGVIFSSLYLKSNGQLACYFQGVSGTSFYDGTGSHTLSVGKLYFLAVTYSSAAGLVGYVNAQVDGTAATQGTLDTTAGALRIGTDFINAGRDFAGSVVDAKIYPRALSAAEIAQLYFDPFAIYRKPSRWWEAVLTGGGATAYTFPTAGWVWNHQMPALAFASAASQKAWHWQPNAPSLGFNIAAQQRAWRWNAQAPALTLTIAGVQKAWGWAAKAPVLNFGVAAAQAAWSWLGQNVTWPFVSVVRRMLTLLGYGP